MCRPFNATSLSQLTSLASVSDAVLERLAEEIGDGRRRPVGPDRRCSRPTWAPQLMQTLKDIASFDAGPTGNFDATLTGAQATFLTGELPAASQASSGLNLATASERLYL